MADTVETTETVTTEPLSNDGNPSTTPVVNVDAAEVERLTKEANQAKMEAAQARNEATRLKAEQDAIKAKQLEEKEEFKTLYEQTQSKLKEIEEAQAAADRQKELSTATEEVFKDYDPKAVELAKVAGLGLSEDSDAARAILKEKLDVFQKQLGTTANPGANNPRQDTPNTATREELTKRANPWEGSPMSVAAAKGDDSAVRSYIKELPAIARMKEIAQKGV